MEWNDADDADVDMASNNDEAEVRPSSQGVDFSVSPISQELVLAANRLSSDLENALNLTNGSRPIAMPQRSAAPNASRLGTSANSARSGISARSGLSTTSARAIPESEWQSGPSSISPGERPNSLQSFRGLTEVIEGPMTPFNEAGPFVFDGGAGRGPTGIAAL